MNKYKNKEMVCPNCTVTYVNKRTDRLQKFCSKSCGVQFRHKNNGLKTFGVDNWKLNRYSTFIVFCELCGRSETTNSSNGTYNPNHVNKLCKDHNHKTNNFRGMLCSTCNRALGWYENHIKEIHAYLDSTKDLKIVLSKIDEHIRA